ncbi:MAG: class I SAM-dependent RNA methyltransferase [Gemmatimonadaceae bacterium]|nr:class I SAM-dependent RNA methyltransferase [Gemmatimonadaceae bacterium]
MSATKQVEIESIAAGGDGVGRSDGLVLFVPRTAPGDLVSVNFKSKGRFARGVVRSIDRASSARVDPPCPHYTRDRCGGCQIQHIEYGVQLAQKQQIVRDAMTRIGKRTVELPEIVGSPKEWEYRTKLTLAIRTVAGKQIAGLHRYDNPAEVFDLRQCPITDVRIVDAWLEIKQHLDLLPTDDAELRGMVRVSEQGCAFVVIGGNQWSTIGEFADAMKSLIAIWWEPIAGRRQLVIDRRHHTEPLASFTQVNPTAATLLRNHVISAAKATQPGTLIDGYSGSGEVAIQLASDGVKVTAIELDADASAWSAEHMPGGSVAIRGRVEDVLMGELPADVVLLNPPRTGLDEGVPAILENAERKPKRVVYTSCNPATLARDVARMPGYEIAAMKSFDMFPQTAHVETVCELVPSAA